MSSLNAIAAKLADETMAAMKETGNDRLFMEIADVIGASSQTLEEAYLTEIRVRLAAIKAQKYLNEKRREAKAGRDSTKPAGPRKGD
jgi:hypothetical protein